ncbi:MAG TPA: hypothetical protein VIK10_08875 [Prolixibacteraceae bacterium]
MKKILFFLLFVLSIQAKAQVLNLLGNDNSGFYLLGGTTFASDFTGIHPMAGISFKGKFDLEAVLYRDKYQQAKRNLLDNNASSQLPGVYLTWWFLRKSPAPFIDINIGLKPGFEFSKYKNYRYILPENGNTVNYKQMSAAIIGWNTDVVLHLNETWWLQPSYVFAYELGQEKLNEQGIDKTNAISEAFSCIAITLAKKFTKGDAAFATCKQYFVGSGTFYNIEFGYVMPF